MEKKTFRVPRISCGHCVMAIQNELREIEGVAGVEGNPADKTIVVNWEAPATEAAIRDRLTEINYPAA
jgi:copper chaperone CopZ